VGRERQMKSENNKVRLAKRVQDLEVYKLAFETVMEIFEITKSFPREEKYSLIDQTRRSSRSVCANLAEGWRKRKYIAVFINKLLDAAQEAAETQTWLEFALKCNYITTEVYEELYEKYEHIFAMLNTMENKADAFCNG
jgi:four helix bundle protein